MATQSQRCIKNSLYIAPAFYYFPPIDVELYKYDGSFSKPKIYCLRGAAHSVAAEYSLYLRGHMTRFRTYATLLALGLIAIPAIAKVVPIPWVDGQLSESTRSYYIGAWSREVVDSTGRTAITLELREDGKYVKTLDANLRGQSFHNTEGGTWTGLGPVVTCSGDGNAPPSRHDLGLYKKL